MFLLVSLIILRGCKITLKRWAKRSEKVGKLIAVTNMYEELVGQNRSNMGKIVSTKSETQ